MYNKIMNTLDTLKLTPLDADFSVTLSRKRSVFNLAEFFIGEDMKLCEIESCSGKYYCKELCKKHYNKYYIKQYYQDNKEHINKQSKQYYENNKEEIKKYKKQYNQDHKEENAKYHKQYRQDNKEKIAEYQKHREDRTEYFKQYNQTPAGRASIKARFHNHRILKKGLTKAIIQRVYEDNIKKHGTLTCYLCFKPIKFGDDSLDHSTPLTRQGTNNYENLGIAHSVCNKRKGTKTLEEWFNNKKG